MMIIGLKVFSRSKMGDGSEFRIRIDAPSPRDWTSCGKIMTFVNCLRAWNLLMMELAVLSQEGLSSTWTWQHLIGPNFGFRSSVSTSTVTFTLHATTLNSLPSSKNAKMNVQIHSEIQSLNLKWNLILELKVPMNQKQRYKDSYGV